MFNARWCLFFQSERHRRPIHELHLILAELLRHGSFERKRHDAYVKPTSGTNTAIRKIDIRLAGTVSIHFQLVSHFKCMKKVITNRALQQETPSINARLTPRGTLDLQKSK